MQQEQILFTNAFSITRIIGSQALLPFPATHGFDLAPAQLCPLVELVKKKNYGIVETPVLKYLCAVKISPTSQTKYQ